MRVVHVSTFETQGGAARAACRLHRGLTSLGVDSRMLVRDRASDDARVQVPAARASRLLARAAALGDDATQMIHSRRKPGVFTATWAPTRVARETRSLEPDVVNLHWLGSGFVPPESLPRIGKPLVWTLHDTYAFTGGCHYPWDCDKYTGRCGACPVLGSRLGFDVSRIVWKRKALSWRSIELTIVAPSRWMGECARKSSLFRDRRVEVIPYGMDTSVFRPVDRAMARELLGLPPDKKLVSFVAAGGASNPIKGFHHLASASHLLPSEDVEVVVAGASSLPDSVKLGVPVRCIGAVHDDLTLALLNSAADVAVVPSEQENLANTVLEALACGNPVIAFDVGGMPDMIIDRVNGVLVPPFDTRALASAVMWVINDSARQRQLSAAARKRAESEYALEVQARRYRALYEDLLRVPSAPE